MGDISKAKPGYIVSSVAAKRIEESKKSSYLELIQSSTCDKSGIREFPTRKHTPGIQFNDIRESPIIVPGNGNQTTSSDEERKHTPKKIKKCHAKHRPLGSDDGMNGQSMINGR